MQVVENWAELHGQVTEYLPDPAAPGHTIARVKVNEVRSLEPYPNLFKSSAGETLEIKLPIPKLPRALPPVDGRIVWRIRRAGPQMIFVHPDSLPQK